jgi:hypothetical protein
MIESFEIVFVIEILNKLKKFKSLWNFNHYKQNKNKKIYPKIW